MWISMCINWEYLVNNRLFIHTLSSYDLNDNIKRVYKSILSICCTYIRHSIYTAINLSFILNLKQNIMMSTLSTNTITITTKKNI